MTFRIYIVLVFFVTWMALVSPEEMSEDFQLGTMDTVVESEMIPPFIDLPSFDNDTSKHAYENDIIDSISSLNDSDTPKTINETRKTINCKLTHINATAEERFGRTVEMVNSSRLMDLLVSDNEITNKETEANCMVVLFYSRLCPFSAFAGPHFNGLARSFPDIKMVALDALKYHNVNTQYGIVGVPTLILFHNGRPIAKFNGTEYTVYAFVKFIKICTGIKEDVIVVVSQDFQGPVPSVVDKEIDYFLVLSWIFILICCIYFASRSSWWKLIMESIQNIWRESAAQHDHDHID